MTRRFTLLCIRGKFWHSVTIQHGVCVCLSVVVDTCLLWLSLHLSGCQHMVPYRIRIDLQILITVRCRTIMG